MTQQNWEHYAFSRGLTLRVLDYLRYLENEPAPESPVTAQLRADIKELEGALAELKC